MSLRLGALALAIPLLAGCPDRAPRDVVTAAAPSPPAPTAPTDRRPALVFIGVDGMDWEVLDPLLRQGRCPTLGALVQSGASGALASPPPRISPLLWASIVTGRYPEDHGILDFFVPGPDGELGPTPSTARRAKALWEILAEHHRRPGVVGFWATWPAEPIDGILVSDTFAPSLFGASRREERVVWPGSWQDELEPVRDAWDELPSLLPAFVAGTSPAPRPPPSADLATRVEHDPVLHLQSMLAATMAYHRATMAILRRGNVDALFVYHQLTDEVAHRFMHFAPPAAPGIDPAEVERLGRAVEASYELVDRLVGEILAEVPRDATVLLVSDHGFLSGPRRLPGDPADFQGGAAAWHRDEGVIVIRAPGIAPGTRVSGDVYDVTPTALALLGLPIAQDMPGRPMLGSDPPRPLATHGAPAHDAGPAPTPDASEDIAKLRALGYIAAGAAVADLSANGWINKGLSLAERGRHPEAREAYRQALQISPYNASALYDLAASLEDHGSPNEAFPLLVRLARIEAKVPPGGLSRLAAGGARGTVEARLAARQALEARPAGLRDWEWHHAMGILHDAEGRRAEARAAARRAVELDPTLPQPILALLRLTPPAERAATRTLCARAIERLPGPEAVSWLAAELAAEKEKELGDLALARAARLRSPAPPRG